MENIEIKEIEENINDENLDNTDFYFKNYGKYDTKKKMRIGLWTEDFDSEVITPYCINHLLMGSMRATGNYVEGKKHGTWSLCFHDHEAMDTKYNLQNWYRNIVYDKTIATFEYDNGVLISSNSTAQIKNGIDSVRLTYKNGKVLTRITRIKDISGEFYVKLIYINKETNELIYTVDYMSDDDSSNDFSYKFYRNIDYQFSGKRVDICCENEESLNNIIKKCTLMNKLWHNTKFTLEEWFIICDSNNDDWYDI